MNRDRIKYEITAYFSAGYSKNYIRYFKNDYQLDNFFTKLYKKYKNELDLIISI